MSAADDAVVYPNGIKTLLANDWGKFFTYRKPVFSKGPRSLPKTPPAFKFLDSILTNEFFAKAFGNFEICPSARQIYVEN